MRARVRVYVMYIRSCTYIRACARTYVGYIRATPNEDETGSRKVHVKGEPMCMKHATNVDECTCVRVCARAIRYTLYRAQSRACVPERARAASRIRSRAKSKDNPLPSVCRVLRG